MAIAAGEVTQATHIDERQATKAFRHLRYGTSLHLAGKRTVATMQALARMPGIDEGVSGDDCAEMHDRLARTDTDRLGQRVKRQSIGGFSQTANQLSRQVVAVSVTEFRQCRSAGLIGSEPTLLLRVVVVLHVACPDH